MCGVMMSCPAHIKTKNERTKMKTLTLTTEEVETLAELLKSQEQSTFFALALLDKLESPSDEAYIPNARKSDPTTSKQGALSVAMRSGSQKHKLLMEYLDFSLGLTDEEAGTYSGLAGMPKCCYWKRCSELRQAGFIAVTGETRLSSVGEQQQVCVITEAGRKALRES